MNFERLVAVESVAARAEVHGWANDLLVDQRRAFADLKTKGLRSKERAATPEECLEKSIQIRVKRERDATHWHDLTNPYP